MAILLFAGSWQTARHELTSRVWFVPSINTLFLHLLERGQGHGKRQKEGRHGA
jgi:hypothetical protein